MNKQTKKVWVVAEGSYSDYHVVGIFSTRENALIVAKAMGLDDDCIDEWNVDPAVEELNQGRWLHTVIMRKDGQVEETQRLDKLFYSDLDSNYFIWDRPNAPAYEDKKLPQALNATVWAKDTKHAIKIVNEIRIQMIANSQWK